LTEFDIECDGHVRRAVEQQPVQLIPTGRDKRGAHARQCGVQLDQHRWKELGNHRFLPGDRQRSIGDLAQGSYLGMTALGIDQGALDMSGKHVSGRGQYHATGLALEQTHAELVLYLENLPVHGRGRNVQAPGRSAHRAARDHLAKVLQDRRMDRHRSRVSVADVPPPTSTSGVREPSQSIAARSR